MDNRPQSDPPNGQSAKSLPNPVPTERRSLLARYGSVVPVLAVATLVRLALNPVVGDNFAFLPYFFAVAFETWYGRSRPAAILLALSGVTAVYLFVTPRGVDAFYQPASLWGLGAFYLVGSMIIFLGETQARAQLRAEDSAQQVLQKHAELEREIAVRRKAEELFQGVLEAAPDAIVIVERDGTIFLVNPQTERLFGYSRRELIGKPVEVLLPERLRDRHPALREQYLSHPSTRSMGQGLDLLGQRKDGAAIAIEIGLSPLVIDSRTYVISSIRDITKRKQAEELQRRTSEEIRDLYNNSLCGYHSLDQDGVFLAVNDTELRWLGYAQEELVGKKKFPDLMTDESRKVFQDNFPVFKERGWVSNLEFDVRRKDGTLLPVLLNATAVRDAAGTYVMSRSSLFDISERKRNEQTIQLYTDIVKNVPLGLTIWHLDDVDDSASLRLVDANPAASGLLGIDVRALLGKTFLQAFPTAKPAEINIYAGVVRSGQTAELKEIYYGDERVAGNYWAVKAFPLPGLRVGLAFENISARKQAEDAIRRLNEELEERVEQRTAELARANQDLSLKNRENEMFVYSVSHDLRSPLVNLQGFSKELGMVARDIRSLLMDHLPADVQPRALALVDKDMAESIQFIQTAVTRLSSIIDALLRLSRAGRVEYQWQAVDVGAVIGRIVQAMQGTISDRGADVTAAPLPAAWGDPTAVEQIFANLIGNALNYLDRGRPGRIEVGAKENAAAGEPGPNGGLLTYYVRDNGRGIPAAHLPKVFQAFQRLHPDASPGEGMGLTLVRRIVERHGGQIWVESTAGAGSTFWVTLPAPAPKDPSPLLQGA